jgi:hypothetical protein
MTAGEIIQLVVFGTGMGGMALSHWRGTVALKNKVQNQNGWLERLTVAVEKQNGRIHDVEITCARTHGVDPR